MEGPQDVKRTEVVYILVRERFNNQAKDRNNPRATATILHKKYQCQEQKKCF